MSEPAELLSVDANHAVATWRRVFVHVWRMHTTLPVARASMANLKMFGAERPGGIGMITIIGAGAPPPSTEVSRELASMIRNAEVRASAVAFEGGGFRASIVRSVITGLAILARPPYPHFVTGTLAEASDWLIESLDRAGVEAFASPAELTAAIDRLRSDLPAGPASSPGGSTAGW